MVSLRVLIFAVVATVSVIPIILFGVWPQSQALDNAVEEVSERHLLLARNLGAALDRYHRDILSTFSFLAGNAIAGAKLHNGEQLLDGLNFQHLCVIDSHSGKVLNSLSPDGYHCPDAVPEDKRQLFNSLAEEGHVVMTGVLPAPDGNPALFLLQRFGSEIAVGVVSTDYFVALAKTISFGRGGHAAIVDQNGRIMAHPLPEWRQSRRDISQLEPVRRMIEGKTGVARFYSPAVKQDMIAGYTVVPGAGWGVMIPQPYSDLEAEAQSVRDYTMVIIAGGTLVALIASWLLSAFVSRPISRFVEATARLRKGEKGTRVALNHRLTARELVELQGAFNEMVETMEKAAKKEMRLRREAEKADRFKSKFLANMSHEIRTPLNAILGFSELIKEQMFGPDDGRYQEYAEDIHQSGTLMLTLINDILDLSKVEAGHEILDLDLFDLAEDTGRCVQMVRQQAMNAGVSLQFDCPGDSLLINADRRKMKQMLLNLLSNAIKFTPPKGDVTVSVERDGADGVAIAVTDTGIGIEPADIEAVLKPFGRVELQDGEIREGTGLGLPLVKALAELHGGSFELDSVYGLGTKATIRLPGVISLHAENDRMGASLLAAADD